MAGDQTGLCGRHGSYRCQHRQLLGDYLILLPHVTRFLLFLILSPRVHASNSFLMKQSNRSRSKNLFSIQAGNCTDTNNGLKLCWPLKWDWTHTNRQSPSLLCSTVCVWCQKEWAYSNCSPSIQKKWWHHLNTTSTKTMNSRLHISPPPPPPT